MGLLLSVNAAGATVVVQVATGSDAARQGYGVGERLVAVDGRGVAGMSGERVDLLLRGSVGESHRVRPDLREADVRVEDLIPLP